MILPACTIPLEEVWLGSTGSSSNDIVIATLIS